MRYKGRYIGCNHVVGLQFGGINSSYDGIFNREEVLVQNGIGDIIPCLMGDVTEAYDILKNKIKEKNAVNFETLCECVFNTVLEYFGDYRNIEDRMNNYTELDFIDSEDDIGKVSNLKGKNAAMCVERAMLSQNLLKSLGINSLYKTSGIIKNSSDEAHAYNLVENNGKYYIFDATIPTLIDDRISPLITEIPKEVFDQISSPMSDIGYSVDVSHYNPLRDMDVHVVYDAGRGKTYFQNENNKQM